MTIIRIALIALAVLATGHANAQTWPDRPIRIMVGFTPGSATDITGRMFAQKLTEALGVAVTIENLPGAGGSFGAERVGKAPPDGYTLYWGANGAMTINPSLLPNPSFDPQRDLAPIARLLVSPSILAVNNDVPVKTDLGRERRDDDQPVAAAEPVVRSAARPRADRAAPGVAEHSGGQQRRAGEDRSGARTAR